MKTFQNLPLSPPMHKAISELGYTEPTSIQAAALPLLLKTPTDFIGLAATGTGKTATFSIPMLEKIDPALRVTQALILCPTRELALQISQQISLLGKYKGLRALAIYGGSGYGDQMHGLKQGAPIVVGTPGRLVDHLERRTLRLDHIHTVILDEADEMISMGFKEDLKTLLDSIPTKKRNIWLFSATMSHEVRKVADTYLHEPKQVQINKTEILPENIEQIYYLTQESHKPEVLCKIIETGESFYGLIFCQTKSLVIELTHYLKGKNYAADCLHGDMDQNARERAMRSFRSRKAGLLICTDIASRGLDVKDITHVINYSLPRELEHYVHRIGRTARSGKSGFAISLVTPSHRSLISRIEKMTRTRMVEGKIPTQKEIGIKKLRQTLIQFQGSHPLKKALEWMHLTTPPWTDILAQMDTNEVAARFLAMSFPEIFNESAEGSKEIPSKKQPHQDKNAFRKNAPSRNYSQNETKRYDSRRNDRFRGHSEKNTPPQQPFKKTKYFKPKTPPT